MEKRFVFGIEMASLHGFELVIDLRKRKILQQVSKAPFPSFPP